jgi:hypothetical protein
MQGDPKREESQVRGPSEERLALRWAALLCGQESIAGLSLHAAKNQILAWAAADLDIQPGALAAMRQPLPEQFVTTRFLHAARSLEAGLEYIKKIMLDLSRAEVDCIGAMMRLAQHFHSDEARLLEWKERARNAPRFQAWLPAFRHAAAYLEDSLPTPFERLEEIRCELRKLCAEPHRFLEARERECFDRCFDEFRKGYIDYYFAAHEDTVHIVGNQEKMESKVDSVALRNLELLSDLNHADRGYLNRVRALGKWVQAHQCNLPVRQILELHPRCYCNFNPMGSRHLAESVNQMNDAIRQGIDHFRSILRRSRMIIIQELKDMRIDDHHAKQIAALLSRGPMIPLRQHSIDILNAVILRHAGSFLTADHRLAAGASDLPAGW